MQYIRVSIYTYTHTYTHTYTRALRWAVHTYKQYSIYNIYSIRVSIYAKTRALSWAVYTYKQAKVGWRGLVVMVKWWGAPIMIVMEPLEVFHMQQELSTSVSYWQYKERQVLFFFEVYFFDVIFFFEV